MYVFRNDHLVLDNTNRHGKVEGDWTTRPQPIQKSYGQLRMLKLQETVTAGKSTPIGPLCLYDKEK